MIPLVELAHLALFGSGDMGAIVAFVLSIGVAGIVIIILNLKK
ncbi:MAG: hypothetical protein ACRECH_14835 [Nitrososphaerales archaeon]